MVEVDQIAPVAFEEALIHAALQAFQPGADGCCVRSFSDGRSLLECGDSFDVILLDIQMSHPDKDWK